jgi:hypothetical protein
MSQTATSPVRATGLALKASLINTLELVNIKDTNIHFGNNL